MISFLHGNLVEKSLTRTVIEINGIGFQLLIPISTFDKLPPVGEKTNLITYLHVREDALQLFGFFTEAEKSLFLMLITSVSGIGPKIALNILSSMPVDSFCNAVANSDIKFLTRINGIGKRSAERLVIELKDKVDEISLTNKDNASATSVSDAHKTAVEDAIAGLATLGFKADSARKSVRKLLKEIPDSEISTELLIRRAVQDIN